MKLNLQNSHVIMDDGSSKKIFHNKTDGSYINVKKTKVNIANLFLDGSLMWSKRSV
jgi:hypothetical protein